ncbi:protein FAM200A-like [Mobula hypostoma]|uniref:protein FAM200A-like n=1 Tax=Mobula hypostoma TaxID=723540 RepID=UPI002FC2AFF8
MVSEVLSHNEKNKKTVVELLKMVPLSAKRATRVEVLAEECFSNLLTDLEKAEAISPATDSSCDRTDMEELSVFARFFDGKTIREELICLLPLSGCSTGEIIFNEWTQFFEKNGLDVSKIVPIVTDGAPSMVGLHKGLSIAGGNVSGTYLLLHNDVHWLSKDRVLERVCDLRDELVSFLSSLLSQKAQGFKRFLSDNKMMAHVLFLCDIMSHLNQLNLQLQGNNHTVAHMYEAIEAFRSKLNLLERDIHGRKLHFPRLREHCEKNEMQEDPVMKDFVTSLAENFRERFESSPKLSGDILHFQRQPFSVSADGQWTAEAKRLVPSIDEATLQLEVLEMGTSDLLKAQHKEVGVSDFWINVVPQAQSKNTRAIAMLLLTLFPFTYIYESPFSSMNSVKNQDRNRLSNAHLGQCLRIATTEYRPNIRRIASSGHCHFSH